MIYDILQIYTHCLGVKVLEIRVLGGGQERLVIHIGVKAPEHGGQTFQNKQVWKYLKKKVLAGFHYPTKEAVASPNHEATE